MIRVKSAAASLMKSLVAIAGILLVLIILWDAFETIILPRRVTRRLRLTSLFYRSMWAICSRLVRAMRNRKRRRALRERAGR